MANEIAIWIGMALATGWFSLFTHELSHAIVAWSSGADVLLFRPWPHFRNGRLYWGRVRVAWVDHVNPLTHVVPLYKDAILVVLFLAGALLLWLPLLTGAIWQVVDAAWWLIGTRLGPGYDGWEHFND